MHIGELARRTQTSPRLLRYYEARGLLEAERDVNCYRIYPEDAVDVVETIRCLLSTGVPTRLISLLLPSLEPGRPVLDTPIDPHVRAELERYRRRLHERHLHVSASLRAIDAYLERTCAVGAGSDR